jgi:hypothetical protein
MVVTAPLDMPADPTPAMTRPTINMADDWAAPHKADPTSKSTKKVRNVHYRIAWSPISAMAMSLAAGQDIP